MLKIRKSERGQALVLMVVGLVALIGFAALAVDGGMVYSDRRYDQSVADAAALAAGGTAARMLNNSSIIDSTFTCNTATLNNILANAKIAGKNSAATNYITLDENLSDGIGIEASCHSGSDRYIDLHVRITSETKTAFAHLVTGAKLKNTVNAVVRVFPSRPAVAGYSLYAMDPNCSADGIDLDGTIDVFIHGGGAFTRSCLGGNGNTSLTVYDDGGVDCLNNPAHPNWCVGGSHFSPSPETVEVDPFDSVIPIPDCSDRTIAPARSVSGETLEPGYYENLPGHMDLKLKPGLYCISGSLTLNGGGALTSIPDSSGMEGVTVVFMNGSYSALGNGGMDLKAALPYGSHPPNVVPGVALIFPPSNHNTLDLGGNSINRFRGTVYVPSGEIDVGGTGDVPASTQFIAFNFSSHGNSQTDISYDGQYFFHSPAKLDLLK